MVGEEQGVGALCHNATAGLGRRRCADPLPSLIQLRRSNAACSRVHDPVGGWETEPQHTRAGYLF